MNKTVARSTAIQVVILILAAILIVLVFPVRVLKETYATDPGIESAGREVFTSEPVTRDDTIVQRFVAQYDKLSAIDVLVEEVTLGRSVEINVFDPELRMMVRRFFDLEQETVPGMVRFPLGLDLKVGEEYILMIRGLYSTVRFGLVPHADASIYLGVASHHDTTIEHGKLALSILYTLPLDKKKSVLLMAGIALLALVLVMAVRRHYQKPLLPFLKSAPKPVSRIVLDPPVTVRRVMQVVLNPLLCAGFGTLFIFNWPLKLFDDRPADILFYALGILIAWGISLVLVNRPDTGDCVKGTGTMTHCVKGTGAMTHDTGDGSVVRGLKHLLQSVSIAAMLWYATDYMNGMFDIHHRVSERQITIAFLLVILLTFSLRELTDKASLAVLATSAAGAATYIVSNRIPIEDIDYELSTQVVRLTAVCGALTVLLVFHMIRMLLRNRATLHHMRPNIFTALTIITALLLVFFRNGRIWSLVLIAYYGLFFLRFAFWEGRRHWNRILLQGLLLNFLASVAYSLLHRYYAAFLTSRFAMRFHTVTVTAEYLSVMCAAALVLVLAEQKKVYNTIGSHVLLGLTASYTIFTLSRTAYLAVIVTGLLLLAVFLVASGKGGGRRTAGVSAAILLSVLIVFPAAFTLQRILPVMVGDPVEYEIENTDVHIRGAVNWDHKNLMCVERFIGHFYSKILGHPEPGYDYPEDDYNYDENGEPLYDDYGNPLITAASGPRRARIEDEYVDTVENFSNGRMTIFKAYWADRNLVGHEGMGALFPDGTTIIHAHNVYLQVMYDCGMIAGVAFTLWLSAGFICGVRRYLRSRQTDPYCLNAAAMIAAFMIVGLTEWNFHYANPMTIALLLGIAPLLMRDEKIQENHEGQATV